MKKLGRTYALCYRSEVKNWRKLDANNNLPRVTNPLGHTTTLTYDSNGELLSITTSGSGTTNYTYQNGLQASMTDPNGNTTIFGYDPSARLISSTNTAGSKTTLAYDAVINITGITNSPSFPVHAGEDVTR